MLHLFKSILHRNYRLFAENLHVSMETIAACYELPKKVFFWLEQQLKISSDSHQLCWNIQRRARSMFTWSRRVRGNVQYWSPTAATDWFDSEKNLILEEDAGSQEGTFQGEIKRLQINLSMVREYDLHQKSLWTKILGWSRCIAIIICKILVRFGKTIHADILWMVDTLLTDSCFCFNRSRPIAAGKRRGRLNFHLYTIGALPKNRLMNTQKIEGEDAYHSIERHPSKNRGKCLVSRNPYKCTSMVHANCKRYRLIGRSENRRGWIY